MATNDTVPGREALWDWGRVLGIPDSVPIQSIRLVANVLDVVKAEVTILIKREAAKEISVWLRSHHVQVETQ